MDSGIVQNFKTAVRMSEVQMATAAALTFTLTYKLYRKLTEEEKPPPPGPWGFPILGHLPLLGKEPYLVFMKMAEKYGDIFHIRMGSWPTVVVNGKRLIREALRDSSDDFSGRPQFISSSILSNGENLGFGPYNEKWHIHRKLANRVLFEFANAKKNPIEDMVHGEIDILMNAFQSQDGRGFYPQNEIYLSVASIIYQITYGRDEQIRDKRDFDLFLKNFGEFTKFVSAGNPVDVMPWLRWFMPSRFAKFVDLIETSRAFRSKRVEEHKQMFAEDHIRDLADGFIDACNTEKRLSEQRIIETIDAIFGAGVETVANTILWGVQLMAAHPEVQKRMQSEIDDVVGNGRRPLLKDRGRMVYTEAVLHEINRFAVLAPLSIPHSTIRDTELGGFSIKKDTVVIINLYSMSYDKDVWGDPDVFRPERFLDDSGQINKSLLEDFLPFSTGNRKCLGEQLARMELFLFFTGMLQRCSFIKPPDVDQYSKDVIVGLTRLPVSFNVQTKLRH